MHRHYFGLRKIHFYIVCQFLICNTILNVTARPGIDSNLKNTVHSFTGMKENVTLTLEDVFPNYIVTSDFCDEDSCKQTYEVANYPYEQITDVFPEVSKRLWDQDVSKSSFIITDRGKGEDEEHERTEAEIYNATFRMQGAPGPKKDVIDVNGRVPIYGYQDPKKANRCVEIFFSIKRPVCIETGQFIRQTIQPLTGKSGGQEYYITNIKSYSQTITVIKCYRPGITCGNKSLNPEGITFSCKQEYEDAQLSSFPVGESISLESHRKIHFKVPKGCSCSMTWL